MKINSKTTINYFNCLILALAASLLATGCASNQSPAFSEASGSANAVHVSPGQTFSVPLYRNQGEVERTPLLAFPVKE